MTFYSFDLLASSFPLTLVSFQGALSKEEVEKLLRHGAYDIFNEDKAGTAEKESNDFVQQDIDSILQRRSRTVVHDNTGSKSDAAGGTFSKARFKAAGTPDTEKTKYEDIDVEDPDFWKKMVGEGQTNDEGEDYATLSRRRKETNYSENAYEQRFQASLKYCDADTSDSGSDSSASDEEDGEMTRWGGIPPNEWKKDHAEALVKFLLSFGYIRSSPVDVGKMFEYGQEYGELQVSILGIFLDRTRLYDSALFSFSDCSHVLVYAVYCYA
jgi:hypothetical protein